MSPDRLWQTLARIETKVDELLERSRDHETRLRSLERARWWMTGAGAAAGAVITKITGGP